MATGSIYTLKYVLKQSEEPSANDQRQHKAEYKNH